MPGALKNNNNRISIAPYGRNFRGAWHHVKCENCEFVWNHKMTATWAADIISNKIDSCHGRYAQSSLTVYDWTLMKLTVSTDQASVIAQKLSVFMILSSSDVYMKCIFCTTLNSHQQYSVICLCVMWVCWFMTAVSGGFVSLTVVQCCLALYCQL